MGAGFSSFNHEKLRRAAWKELRTREVATTQLLYRIKAARERQVDLLKEAAAIQAQQLQQLEEISTELWNAWQLSSELQGY